MLSVLQMKPTETDEWRQLPRIGKFVGEIGTPPAHLWDWTLTYRVFTMKQNAATSSYLQAQSEVNATVDATRPEVEQFFMALTAICRKITLDYGRDQINSYPAFNK